MLSLPRKLELFYYVLFPYSWLGFEAAEKAGLSEEQANCLLEKCSTEEVKKKLRDSKYSLKIWGLWASHNNGKSHMLFGSDRMELLAHLLGEQWQCPGLNTMKGKLSAFE